MGIDVTIDVEAMAVAPLAVSISRSARASTPVDVTAPVAVTEVGAPSTDDTNEIG
jgi:hypothetical protein